MTACTFNLETMTIEAISDLSIASIALNRANEVLGTNAHDFKIDNLTASDIYFGVLQQINRVIEKLNGALNADEETLKTSGDSYAHR